jgi:hypothetical protein
MMKAQEHAAAHTALDRRHDKDEHTNAALWWENWARDHENQIKAYNEDVAQNGLWSDGLRLF